MAAPTPPRNALRIVVAGAGAFGLASALCLAQRGADVTLCDPARPGDNASGVAAGMLAPAFEALLDPPSQGHFALLSAARALWPPFADSLGLTLERDGAIWAGSDPLGVEARLTAMGARARRLSALEAGAAVPGLNAVGETVFTPEDWRIDSSDGLLALRAATAAAGVRFFETAVMDFTKGQAGLVDGQRLAADRLVVATGAARSDLAPEIAGLTPVKGHILRTAAGPRTGPVVRAERIYVRPHRSGAIAGASMQEGRTDLDIDREVVAELSDRAAALFPCLHNAPHHVGVGIRATTQDGLPLVGRSREPGVLLAAGARRNGWLLAPQVGQAVAAAAFSDEMEEVDLFGQPVARKIVRPPTPPPGPDRLLFALYPDADTTRAIEAANMGLRRELGLSGRPRPSSILHVTLRHVGDFVGPPSEVVEALKAAASGLVFPAFELVLDEAVRFAGSKAFVLLAREAMNGALIAFQRALCERLDKAGAGWRVGGAAFAPHLTLSYEERDAALAVEPIRWTAREFTLVHSLVGQTRHVPIARFALA